MKILLGYFNAKLGREDTFKLTTGNETLHEDSNGNGVKVVKCNAQPIKLCLYNFFNYVCFTEMKYYRHHQQIKC